VTCLLRKKRKKGALPSPFGLGDAALAAAIGLLGQLAVYQTKLSVSQLTGKLSPYLFRRLRINGVRQTRLI